MFNDNVMFLIFHTAFMLFVKKMPLIKPLKDKMATFQDNFLINVLLFDGDF